MKQRVMKIPQYIIATALLLVLAGLTKAQTPTTELKFLQALEQSEYDAAHAMFSEDVAAQLSRDQLQQIWNSLPAQAGEYHGHGPARVEPSETGRLVVFRLDFATVDLDARINVNEAGRIDGFWIVPAVEPESEAAVETSNKPAERELLVNDELPALLTLPEGDGHFPAVVLVHGSGPGDRDQTLGPNKPFRDLAHGLAKHGIASLRYDKRTRVAPESLPAAFTVEHEVLADARAAIDLLQSHDAINPEQIYAAGLSLGGLLAPRIGQSRPDLAGLVLLAAPARGIEVIVPEQLRYISGLDGEITDIEAAQLAQIEAQAAAVADYDDPDSAEPGLLGVPQSYLLDLRDYDPVATAQSLQLRMLILQGGRDYQVTVADDFSRWQQAFGPNERVELKQYPNLNHLFMAGEGMAKPAEYMMDGGGFSAQAIEDIAAWINKTKN